MKKHIPLFEFVIDETQESGVKAISIVSNPAFESKLIAFAATKPQFVLLADAKGKKRKVAGLALIPDVPVFRVDEITGMEYNGFFSKDTIEKIVEKFHDEKNNNNVNLNHNENQFVDAVLIEDFIVDSPARVEDLKQKGITHENILGSWYVCYKIKNEEIFQSILDGGNKIGFSVECFLNTIMVEMNKAINKNNLKKVMKKNNKSLLEKIIEIFSNESLERALVPELAVTIEWSEPGKTVNQVTTNEQGNETLTPIGPGEFNTDSGVVVVDDSSNLVEVRELPVQPEPVPAAEVVPDNSSTETMKAYPWDQCISDQLAAGYSQEAADKICGYIKANNSAVVPLSDEILQSILTPEEYACKKKKLNEDFYDVFIKLEEEVLVDPEAPISPDMMPPDGTDPNAPPAPDVKSKTIGEIVGENDGEYWVKVVVSGGQVTEAEVSSETDLLKTSLEEVKKENEDLKDKLKEPIGEPILTPEVPKKDWNKMTAYEKAIERSRM